MIGEHIFAAFFLNMKLEVPVINVQIVYPGASPTEVENSVPRKVEDALSSMEGIVKIQSYSYESLSMLFVTFTYGTDIDKSIADAQNYIDAKRSQLPVSVLSLPRVTRRVRAAPGRRRSAEGKGSAG